MGFLIFMYKRHFFLPRVLRAKFDDNKLQLKLRLSRYTVYNAWRLRGACRFMGSFAWVEPGRGRGILMPVHAAFEL